MADATQPDSHEVTDEADADPEDRLRGFAIRSWCIHAGLWIVLGSGFWGVTFQSWKGVLIHAVAPAYFGVSALLQAGSPDGIEWFCLGIAGALFLIVPWTAWFPTAWRVFLSHVAILVYFVGSWCVLGLAF